MEGIGQIGLFEEFLLECKNMGVRFCTLGEIARFQPKEKLPLCFLETGEIPGRAGKVALQGKEWRP